MEDSPKPKLDTFILTTAEHRMIGSGEGRDDEPFLPVRLQGKAKTPEAVKVIDDARKLQGEISFAGMGPLFGFVDLEAPIIRLSDLDSKSGEVINSEPELVGYKLFDGTEVRDPEKLKSHELTEEARKKLFLEGGTLVSLESRTEGGY